MRFSPFHIGISVHTTPRSICVAAPSPEASVSSSTRNADWVSAEHVYREALLTQLPHSMRGFANLCSTPIQGDVFHSVDATFSCLIMFWRIRAFARSNLVMCACDISDAMRHPAWFWTVSRIGNACNAAGFTIITDEIGLLTHYSYWSQWRSFLKNQSSRVMQPSISCNKSNPSHLFLGSRLERNSIGWCGFIELVTCPLKKLHGLHYTSIQ